MKTTIVLLACSCGLMAQPAPQSGAPKAPASKTVPAKKSKAAAKKAEAPPEPSGLPANAKQMADGDWRWVDRKGQAWIYRRSMMGYARWPEKNAPQTASSARTELQVEDLGETVRFSRRGPVALSSWTKKKTDAFDADEQAALDALKSKEQK